MHIVSVDDFGIGPTANKRILALVRAKKIDRVAIMAYGSVSSEEVRQLLESGVALDIHLDSDGVVALERNVTEKAIVQVMRFGCRFLFGKQSVRRVERRWKEQIQQFFSLFGRYPDGLNAHRHAHFFPPFFRIAVRLAVAHNMRYIRLGKYGYASSRMAAVVLNGLRLLNRGVLRRHKKLQTSDVLVSADWLLIHGEMTNGFATERTAEIIFHPERDEEWRFLSNCVNSRVEENFSNFERKQVKISERY